MKRILFTLTAVLLLTQASFAKVTWLQYFYAIKKIFPDTKEIAIMLPKDQEASQKAALAKAAVSIGVKVKLYLVEDARSIGSNIKMIPDNSVLVVYDAPVLMEKSSRVYILSRCKEKNITVVTASQEYSDSGALIGLLRGDDGKLKIVVNLKFSPELAAKFTPEFIQKTGVSQVLQ